MQLSKKKCNPQVGDYELTVVSRNMSAGIPFGRFTWKDTKTGRGGEFSVFAKAAAPAIYHQSPPVVVPKAVITAAKKVLKGK